MMTEYWKFHVEHMVDIHTHKQAQYMNREDDSLIP